MSFGKKSLTREAVVAPRGAARERDAARQGAVRHVGAPAKWSRIPAFLVDNAVSFVAPWTLIAVVDAFAGPIHFSGVTAFFLASLVSLLYFTTFESSAAQATPGKRMMGLVVTDADGRRISPNRALWRNSAGRLVDALSPFYLGYTCAFFTKEARAAHDFVAGTRVRRADGAEALAATFA